MSRVYAYSSSGTRDFPPEQLPSLMVAPTGARRSKLDHPSLPMTISETVATAKSCYEAGADGLHLHVRDADGAHVLDAGLYREAMAELGTVVPNMYVQVTTEAVGMYKPAQQRALVKQCSAAAVSISIAELMTEDEASANIDFYNECTAAGIAVQHILYDVADLQLLASLHTRGLSRAYPLQLLFVLGRYTLNQQSAPADLKPFLRALAMLDMECDWAACAFGVSETECLMAAHAAGGKLRVGFENSLWHSDGRLARDNADRVADIKARLSVGATRFRNR